MSRELYDTFEDAVEDGLFRVRRSRAELLATGAVGGIDVSIGVFALLLLIHLSGNPLIGALGFTIGFVALALGRSELFTENFLVPIAPLVAGKARAVEVLRLWVGTGVMNLVGGWVLMAVVMRAYPQFRPISRDLATHYIELGIGLQSFATAVLAGVVITVMTWMERGSSDAFGRVVSVVAAGFLLAAGEMNHVVVASLEMFAALQTSAPFGYADWAGAAAWAALGNMIGGIGLVTVLRFVQIGRDRLEESRRRPEPADAPPGPSDG